MTITETLSTHSFLTEFSQRQFDEIAIKLPIAIPEIFDLNCNIPQLLRQVLQGML